MSCRQAAAGRAVCPVVLTLPPGSGDDRGKSAQERRAAAARTALYHSARLGGLVIERMAQAANGAPLPDKGIYWSVAHARIHVAAVAAPYPVGIDIEDRGPVETDLPGSIADRREWSLCAHLSEVDFYRFWTAKEAVLKALGIGLAGLPHCRVVAYRPPTELLVAFADRDWPVNLNPAQSRFVAAVTTGIAPLHWHQLPD